jgi:hypothetical protein
MRTDLQPVYDRSRQPERKARLGGALVSSSDTSSTHPDLQPLANSYSALAKQEGPSTTAAANAFAEYDRLTGPDAPVLTPPVQAGRLSTLLKTLATAENSVGEAVKARKAVISELEKILENHNTKLAADEDKLSTLQYRKSEIESKKRAVEAEIMRSLETEGEPERPIAEPLTPPPVEVESLTPVGSPTPFDFGIGAMNVPAAEQQPEQDYRPPPVERVPSFTLSNLEPPLNAAIPQEHAPVDPRRSASLNGDPRLAKRPRLGSAQHNDEFAVFAEGGIGEIDEDVDAMLNAS